MMSQVLEYSTLLSRSSMGKVEDIVLKREKEESFQIFFWKLKDRDEHSRS